MKASPLLYALIRPRWRKVLSDLWSNRARSALVILSIAVGIFAVGTVTTIYFVLQTDMKTSYLSSNPSNVIIFAGSFHPDFVDSVRRMPEVAAAQGEWSFRVRGRGPQQSEWSTVELKAVYEPEKAVLNQVILKEGVFPPGKHEIVLDQYKMSDLDVRLGDTIEIKLPSNTVRSLKVVGIIQDQSIGAGGGGGFFITPTLGYIDFGDLEWLEQPALNNRLYASARNGGEDEAYLSGLAYRIGQNLDQENIRVYGTISRRSSDHPNRVYVDAIAGILIALGFLVVFLSAFLITNTLSALLNRQVQQIGVMKTLGARRRQVIILYMSLITAFSGAALALAMPLSSSVSFWLLGYLSREINFQMQGYRVVHEANLLQIGVALLVSQGAGIFPILHGSRISVQEALSGIGASGGEVHPGFFDRLGDRVRRLPRPLLISLRNTFRSKVRLALTLLTLVLGGAIFIATFNVRDSLTQYIQRLSHYFSADISLTFDRPHRVEEIRQVAQELAEVQVVEGWAGADAQLVLPDGTIRDNVDFIAPPGDSVLIQPIQLSGRWVRAGEQNTITLSELFMERYPDLKLGDTVRLKINGDTSDWEVVGFFQFAGKSAGLFAYTNYESLSRITHLSNRAWAFRISADLPDHSLKSQEDFGTLLEQHFKARGYTVTEVSPGQQLLASAANGLNVVTIFLLIMAGLTAAVGSIGLTGTMSMNVMERVREIGVMRAIGATDRAIMTQVIVEGLFIGAVSWVLGSALSFPISKAMADVVSYSIFGAPASFRYSLESFGIWLLVVMALSAFASLLPARSAARLTIREVLSYE